MGLANSAVAIAPLEPTDIVAVAQCTVLDAEVFPYPSAPFWMRSSSGRVWVARAPDDPRVLGFVAGRGQRAALHLEGLAVDSTVRRHGVGRALVREALAFARTENLWAVTLHVSVTNKAAIALYDREGFLVAARLPDFYPARAFHGERDAYEMALRIAP